MRRHSWTGRRGDQWELLLLPALVQWTWLQTCARATGCKIDPLDWLLADTGRQPEGKESATCSTLLAPSPSEHAGHKECGISKTCFRATQGESLRVGVEVSLVLLVTYARFLILPTSRHSPSASTPPSMLPTGLLFDLPFACSQMRLMIFSLSFCQAELALPVPIWYAPCLVVAPMRRFAHLSWSHSGAAAGTAAAATAARLIYS